MDISDLPFYVVVLLVLSAFLFFFFFAKRLSTRWLRWPVRGGMGTGTFLTTSLLLLSILGEFDCTARAPAIFSSDGKHVAVQRWGLQGALGADFATVKVRHRYSPFFQKVYSGPGYPPGPFSPDRDPQVRWLDNRHLLIRYHDWGYEYDQSCAPRASGVDIICETLPLPQPPEPK